MSLVTSTVIVTSLLYLDCTRYKKGLLFVCATCMVVKVIGSGSLAVQLASPHRTPYIHTTRMLPHCHNGPFIFLLILNLVTLKGNYELPEDDLNRDRSMLEHFKCFNIKVID